MLKIKYSSSIVNDRHYVYDRSCFFLFENFKKNYTSYAITIEIETEKKNRNWK